MESGKIINTLSAMMQLLGGCIVRLRTGIQAVSRNGVDDRFGQMPRGAVKKSSVYVTMTYRTNIITLCSVEWQTITVKTGGFIRKQSVFLLIV